MSTITTLTLNPSFDRTLSVAALERGEVHRLRSSLLEPGGKGVNIARAVAINGGTSRAIYPADDDARAAFENALSYPGLICEPVPRGEPTRTNIAVIEDNGTTTKLNESGAPLSPEILEALIALAVHGEGGGVIAAAGSLPEGSPLDLYAGLASRLAQPDRTLALDTSGPALKAMVGHPVAVAKPNLEELEELIGESLPTFGAVVDAVNDLRAGGWQSVLVSLGEAGALLVSDEGAVMGCAPVLAVRNTVGAGDALLAGFLAGGGVGREALAEGLAWAHAAVSSARTTAPAVGAHDHAAVALSDVIEPNSSLKEIT
jgi:1-phosphofructokinase family hexose kinase